MVRKEVLKIKKDGFGGAETGTLGAIIGRAVTWVLTHKPSLMEENWRNPVWVISGAWSRKGRKGCFSMKGNRGYRIYPYKDR